ncbi:MAG: 30S ribosomal protein S1 [Spirochaetes bacterium]|nr:30S ribosomal protein S1 [Spirochaetota bacterium]
MTEIITLDGPAGAGKSTVAKRVAKRLGYKYLDTGATYRCVALYFIEKLVNPETDDIDRVMRSIDIQFGEDGTVTLNGADVTEAIRTKAVNEYVSPVSAIPAVRTAMVDLQRRIAQSGGYVIDGRDIGTVVFPDAKYKFFIDASVDERARRRFEEERAKGFSSSLEEVKKNVITRDTIDSTREVAPLTKASDARVIDTTSMSIDEVVDAVITTVQPGTKAKIVLKQKPKAEVNKMEAKEETEYKNTDDDATLTPEELEFRRALEGEDEGDLTKGEIIKGRVIQFDESFVFVSLGLKAEGKIHREEFDREPAIGDEVEVQILQRENNAGEAIASKIAVDRIRSREVVELAWTNKANVKGIVKAAVKGGYSVSVGGLPAFCPRSHIDTKRNLEDSEYLNNEYDFRVIEKKGRDLVVSRRAVLEEMREYNVSNFMGHLNDGDVIRGKVKNIESFGIFVEIVNGLDGFLAFSNIAWEKVKEPTKALKKGEEREFKVLHVDREKRKIDLGIKQLSDDPWNNFIAKYGKDEVIKGEVTSIKEFGAFIKVYPGVEGLAHISELSWAKHVNHPKEVVKVGDFVECKILNIDSENRKLSLGLKQVKENPWESVDKRFPIGKKIECTVRKIFKNYAVLGVTEDLEGTIDVSDFDWKNALVNIDNYFKEGDTVSAVVLAVDGMNRKIKLGVKQLSQNPWEIFRSAHPVGSVIEGTVNNVSDVGAVVQLTDSIDGFVHVSQLDTKRIERVGDVIKTGEKLQFVIKSIDSDKRRVSLSRKDYFSAMEKRDAEKYLSKEDPSSMTYSFADKLKNLDK